MEEKTNVSEQEVLETNEQSDNNAKDKQEQPKEADKTFTQAELDDIVAKRLAREEKKREEAVKEAEKLAKMNEQQKKDYEIEKYKREVEELRAENNRNAMRSEASKMLAEQNIKVDDGILKFVVGNTAEETKENVDSFAQLFKTSLDLAVQEHFKANGRQIETPGGAYTTNRVKSIAEMAEEARIIK